MYSATLVSAQVELILHYCILVVVSVGKFPVFWHSIIVFVISYYSEYCDMI